MLQHITRLQIWLRDPPADFDSLQQILAKLVNVRWCTIDGRYITFLWKDLTPALATAFIDFLSRQPLRGLHLNLIERIPPIAFLHAAPSLSFFQVYINNVVDDTSTIGSPLHPNMAPAMHLLHSGPTPIVN